MRVSCQTIEIGLVNAFTITEKDQALEMVTLQEHKETTMTEIKTEDARGTKTIVERDIKIEARTDTKTDPEIDTRIDPEIDIETDTRIGPETDMEIGTRIDLETDIRTEIKTDLEIKTELKTKLKRRIRIGTDILQEETTAGEELHLHDETKRIFSPGRDRAGPPTTVGKFLQRSRQFNYFCEQIYQ